MSETTSKAQPAPEDRSVLGRPVRRASFDVLRVVAIVGVVAIHTFSRIISTSSMDGTWQQWIAIVLDIGFVWAVPVFVMISGALILRPRSFDRGTPEFYRRRALRILPALVFWHIFYLWIVRMLINGQELTVLGAAELVGDGRAYTQLYFLWVILGLYLVAPVIAAFVNTGAPSRAFWVGGLALLCTTLALAISAVSAAVGSESRPIATVFFTMWVPYVGYFVLGYALARLTQTWRQVVAAAIVAVVLAVVTILQYGAAGAFTQLDAISPVSYFAPIVAMLSVTVFLAAIGIFDRIPLAGRTLVIVRVLSDASFGVFLVHLAVIAVIARLWPALNDGASLSRTTLLFIVTLVTSYAISIAAGRVPFLRRLF